MSTAERSVNSEPIDEEDGENGQRFGLRHRPSVPPVEPILLRADEVTALLRLGRTKVLELLATGDLPSVRIGRCVRIPRRALQDWVDRQTRPVLPSRRA